MITSEKNHPGPASACQIGISVYRQPLPWLKQCIDSALLQKSKGLRIQITIRTDGLDACDFNSLTWLRKTAAENAEIELIEGSTRLGTFASYRRIFANSSSPFLCQLDADDWLEPEALDLGLETLSKYPDAPFLYTDYLEVEPDGSPRGLGARCRYPFDQRTMLVQFITFHLRLVRRAAYQRCGDYDPSLLFCGDYDLSLRLCEIGDPARLASPLYNYRLHDSNTSGRYQQETITEAFQVANTALKRRKQGHLFTLQLDESLPCVTLSRQMGPFVIAGMHRSGTSLLALMLQTLGIDLGQELLSADQQNPDGYGEDLPVVSLQRRLLQQQSAPTGWPDWGWDGQNVRTAAAADESWYCAAKTYLKSRRRSNQRWGWKDPRSTLLLEHWLKLEPGLCVIGIYREPWDVVDALQRISPPVFLEQPGWGLQIWQQYNKALLQFAEQHRERCILINSGALVENPMRLTTILQRRWQWEEPMPREATKEALNSLIRPDHMKRLDHMDPLPNLYQSCQPEAWDILAQLNQIAELPAPINKVFFGNAPIEKASPKSYNHSGPADQQRKAELAVIITSHNQGVLLLEALASVERHTPNDLRLDLLIVDDGSTDPTTLDVLNNLEEAQYRLIRQGNKGLATARNTGLESTYAPIVLYLDDDNRLLQPCLRRPSRLWAKTESAANRTSERRGFMANEPDRQLLPYATRAPGTLRRLYNRTLSLRGLGSLAEGSCASKRT
jgi:glycosyltransferase involved in cell wall biosynthesis